MSQDTWPNGSYADLAERRDGLRQAAAMPGADPRALHFEDRLADELAGAAGRTAAQTTRMVQDLLARFSQDDLRDDMTILVARVTSPAAG